MNWFCCRNHWKSKWQTCFQILKSGQQIKVISCKNLNKIMRQVLPDFAWQNGYGIFSIGFSQIESLKKYIAGQEEHHRKISFQDEFRQLLKRYELEFDERYVWD
ncbi:MAG: transposase [Verrucomicrobiota bacterium]